ncbi:MAG: TetR/AcrR family transcriptional regulator [Porphyromonas sp.]|uniref:TetR/AcrR family transcriptional regulator n=1 Tax=Porphyromonas sp. TaxID=1924944 RepID=UPI001A3858E6|nr:TetR/AcrR family transcriptional regulator [Porphyromonas sp.]MBL6452160.1 TetR/AcrR family transcriptional regulator [Porphyromonas sp.]
MKTTKETILKESFKLFLAKGYDGTSVPDIERAAKITRGAIFHHFANKEDIFKQSADYFVLSFLEEVNYGEEYLNSATPLKAFMGKSLKIIEARMEKFLQKTTEKITPASFMSFTLYLKDHYEGWQEKAIEYEKLKIENWERAINLAKEKNEIRPDTNTTLLASTFHNLYMGLSYGGALVDKLSIPELQRLWDYVYQQQTIK